jgi:hypothetical protein
LASRISYVIFNGCIGDLNVLHSCDNVLCINPKHLWLGTPADNSQDMLNKGREAPQDGENNNAAKLNNEKVASIKKDITQGVKQYKIALKYGVCKQTITLIKQGKIWGHVC